MANKHNKTARFERLDDVRAAIDAADDAILRGLKQRMGLIADVKRIKHALGQDGVTAMRPGREMVLLRRLVDNADGAVSPQLVSAVWREIIGEATQAQANMKIHLAETAFDQDIWPIVRDHFGAAAEIIRHSNHEAAFAALAASKADVVIVPCRPIREDSWITAWLAGNARGAALNGAAPLLGPRPQAFMFNHAPIEPTGADFSVITFEAGSSLDEASVIGVLKEQGLAADMTIRHGSAGFGSQITAICDGFIESDYAGLQQLEGRQDIAAVRWLGVFPAPIGMGTGK
jgi:chorismate mutase